MSAADLEPAAPSLSAAPDSAQGWVPAADHPARDRYIDRFARFIEQSPTAWHAAHAAAERLAEHGFTRHEETAAWPALAPDARGYLIRDGAIVAWRAGSSVSPRSALRVLGAHSDSPGFALKPAAPTVTEGWTQLGVEIYGGPLLNSWLDRDLAVAGRLVTRDGAELLVRTDPVARIPQLAIHLDRGVNDGLTLDKQSHTQPILGVAGADLAGLLERASGVDRADIAGADLRLVETQAPARIGVDRELFASGRLDNLSSVFAGLEALLWAEPAPDEIAVLAVFDHEEVGSETRAGAGGPLLRELHERLLGSLDASREDLARSRAASWVVSADAGHAVHPNYVERHDTSVRPHAGAGPMLKVNAKQRYTSDAHGEALWRRVCEAARIPTQVFVSNNAVPCGSTIGPITATRTGMRTVDVGVPLLSMHSVRELAHVDDLWALSAACGALFRGV